MEWMIYGANGYTGALMVEEAVRRGLRPVLAGRSREAIEPLAQKYGLPARVFGLDKPQAVAMGLRGMELVLHCAGPFSKTSLPMVKGCLEAGAHYLDITGEIDVFAACHALDAEAKQRGIVVLPGSGFDVVPTDCLAAILKLELPSADSLVLAFDAPGGPSPGTAKTAVEGLGKGGRARINGELTQSAACLENPDFRQSRRGPVGDDHSLGRCLYRQYLDRHSEHRSVYVRATGHGCQSS